MILNDQTIITVLKDGLIRSIPLADLVKYLEGTFTVKRSVYEKRKGNKKNGKKSS